MGKIFFTSMVLVVISSVVKSFDVMDSAESSMESRILQGTVPCNPPIANCNTCSAATVCSACATGFYGSQCLPCGTCMNGTTCTMAGCSACAPGFANAPTCVGCGGNGFCTACATGGGIFSVPNCTTCQSGWTVVNGTCTSICNITGCASCATNTTCGACALGMWGPQCAQCGNCSGVCDPTGGCLTGCASGFTNAPACDQQSSNWWIWVIVIVILLVLIIGAVLFFKAQKAKAHSENSKASHSETL